MLFGYDLCFLTDYNTSFFQLHINGIIVMYSFQIIKLKIEIIMRS